MGYIVSVAALIGRASALYEFCGNRFITQMVCTDYTLSLGMSKEFNSFGECSAILSRSRAAYFCRVCMFSSSSFSSSISYSDKK